MPTIVELYRVESTGSKLLSRISLYRGMHMILDKQYVLGSPFQILKEPLLAEKETISDMKAMSSDV